MTGAETPIDTANGSGGPTDIPTLHTAPTALTAPTAPAPSTARQARQARAGLAETARFVATHTLPVFVRGVVSPRFKVVSAYAALDQYGWSAATLRAMRKRHGGAPVTVRGLSGQMLVLFDPEDIRQFFEEPVRTLAMDAEDKLKGLIGIEPTGVICSHGDLREDRRKVNDEALAWGSPVHPACAQYQAVVEEESRPLTDRTVLDFEGVRSCLARISRRVVLGDRAADDEELAGWLRTLRDEGNWMGLRKSRTEANKAVYAKASERIAAYAADAPAHTLAARALAHPAPEGADPLGQVHHWLLAIDVAAPVVARTLLLLAGHPAEQDAAHADAVTGEPALPRLRACVQESVRLYPIVPDLVRVTRAETEWRGVRYPAGTSVLVPIGFHQRDPAHVPAGDLFVPGRWLEPDVDRDTRMAPFSHGGGRCPGDQLALLLTSAVCAQVLRSHRIAGGRPAVDPHRPLPGTLDTAAMRLWLASRRDPE
ncbi:cytochrome P450 [Streptomyces virginiae]|uniref:cytochrome P450 n=1 Tax=Streptomyces virginiae TaxID=1961 RepID=UPI003719168A